MANELARRVRQLERRRRFLPLALPWSRWHPVEQARLERLLRGSRERGEDISDLLSDAAAERLLAELEAVARAAGIDPSTLPVLEAVPDRELERQRRALEPDGVHALSRTCGCGPCMRRRGHG